MYLKNIIISRESVASLKVVFILYSAISSPLDRSNRFNILFALPGRPVHSNTNSASPGSILAMQQLSAKTKSLTCSPSAVYSQVLIYTAESTGASIERTKMPNLRNSSKGGFVPGLTLLRVRHSTAELRAPHKKLHFSSTRIEIAEIAISN